jgi:hypothetical protein
VLTDMVRVPGTLPEAGVTPSQEALEAMTEHKP